MEKAGILENIQKAYEEEDGSIYCMPVRFGIPILAGGSGEDVYKRQVFPPASGGHCQRDK